MAIRVVIFDLDDTLFDQASLRELAREQCVRAMIDRGLNCSFEDGVRKMKELTGTDPLLNKFKEVVKYFGPYSDELWEYGKNVYINANFEKLNIFPESKEVLEKLRRDFKLVLVTEGSLEQQNKKIDNLGVRKYFDFIFIPEIGEKEKDFAEALEILRIMPQEILVIGDRIDKEISIGNKLGMKTVRILRGIYNHVSPHDDLEKPDYEIRDLRELFEIINTIQDKTSGVSSNKLGSSSSEDSQNVSNLADINKLAEQLGGASCGAEKSIYHNGDIDLIDNIKQDKLGGSSGQVGVEQEGERGQVKQTRANSSGISVNNKNINKKQLKIVAIGGGTGLPTLVEGLRKYTDNITMIVTVTDTGRSSGVLRRELEVLPPGDIRNCLIALSNSEKLMCDLFQYRFENGSLEGHSFGNLLIAALTKLTGSFEKGVEEASRILKLKGRVLPSTFDNVHICAELEDGNVIEEENNIIDRHNKYVYLRPGIKRVFLKPLARANEKALEAIKDADLIILCPGSLFTSVISNLLVNGIAEAVCSSHAKKVYVCNMMTQVSQTHRYKASDHVKRILEYLRGSLDYVILNKSKPSEELLESYKRENAFLVENDVSEIEQLGVKVIVDNLLDKSAEKKMLWEKKDLLRHEPSKVAGVLVGLV